MKRRANTGRSPRRLIINADDYGMDHAVDAAILRLAELGVVTATSAMVLSPSWSEAARKLRDAPLSRGLHLDFTSPFFPGENNALGALALRAFTHRLDARAVRATIDQQLTLFEEAMGVAPDFIDGHQHVHQFPVIGQQLLQAISKRYGAEAGSIAIRSCIARRWRGVKAAVVAATGAARFTQRAQAAGHKTNSDFAGVYDFAPNADLTVMWRRWLSNLQGATPLIMCHVAIASEDTPHHDLIRAARINEYGWFAGEFRDLIAEFNTAPILWQELSFDGR